MSKLPMIPMLVQYLAGLCCLKANPEVVDIILGDMVLDTKADEERDVDVTVTISESGATTHAFKAYEVKNEGAPLDVATVEQLCAKLSDMPSVTHKAIVSASGFTAGAKSKAAGHGVTLYEFRPWTRPLQEQFPALTMKGAVEECFRTSRVLLYWMNRHVRVDAPEAKGQFNIKPSDPMLDRSGRVHSKYKALDDYSHELLLRSTEILCTLEPAMTLFRTFPIPYSGDVLAGPTWPHTHTLDVRGDDIYVDAGSGACRIDTVTITGDLQFQRTFDGVHYYVVEEVSGGEAFAGALI